MLDRRRFFQSSAAALLLARAGRPGCAAAAEAQRPDEAGFEPVRIPDWVHEITRMTFAGPGELDAVAACGAQVLHTNVVWPHYPLRRDGGGLSAAEAKSLDELVDGCHRRGIKLVLGLPPFPSVELVRAHPDWRVHDEPTGKIVQVAPDANNLGTRLGCNLGPWGDHLIEVCGELVEHHHVDGFSFDGNYQAAICLCPACRAAYQREAGEPLPGKVDLADLAYRRYLVWRGERLEDHYRRLQGRIKRANPDAVLMSWTVNAGRYGHFLTSPRAMPTRLNLLFDLPMQEWWLDETNLGASVAPAFGAAYLRAVTGDRPCAAEPYLMSRGNPYGTDSFPVHERRVRGLLAVTNGNVGAHSLGFPGHRESTRLVLDDLRQREAWLKRVRRLPWGAILVSEQTRQFHAYGDIAGRFLPHVFGAFRVGMEEHLPLNLINDWDLTLEALRPYRVLVLPGAVALSDRQAEAVRAYVAGGGSLVATGETSLCDELGRPRRDFALADLFGVSYRGRPQPTGNRPALDANFAVAIDDAYWNERIGVGRLSWTDHPLVQDDVLRALVPTSQVIFRGPAALVSPPKHAGDVALRMVPEGSTEPPLPAAVARSVGRGRVVYLAAALDAALYSYGFPYQRRLLARAIEWAAGGGPPVRVSAPMCVQTTCFEQADDAGRRLIVHCFNGLNTAAHHGHPANDVPLREEAVPVHGLRVRLAGMAPKRCHLEPGGRELAMRRDGDDSLVDLPPLEIHYLLVAEL